MFERCAELLHTPPARAVVFEDSAAGVEAGGRGGFGLVVGVDRDGSGAALRDAGADLVVADLAALDPERLDAAWRTRRDEAAWRVEEDGLDPSREPAMESLFAIGNGYLCVRGGLDRPLPGSAADLFIAGIYDRKRAQLPYSEVEFMTPQREANPLAELVALPFPLRVAVRLGGQPLDAEGPDEGSLRRRLDLRRGVLHVEAVYETPEGRRTALKTRRCASSDDPHLLLQDGVLAPLNHWAELSAEPTLDEPQLDSRYPHVERVERSEHEGIELVRYVTRASGLEVCLASSTGRTDRGWRRRVSVFTSRDGPAPSSDALNHARRVAAIDFDVLLERHAERWRAFWEGADIGIPGSPATEQALRFGSYHMAIAAGDDPRVSVPARALSGRAYEGHVFWDTEIFMLPFYLHVAPEKARNLLLFRHGTLEGARRRAQSFGCRGACYAWESNVQGDDVTPDEIVMKSTGTRIPVFTGRQQLHVTADIAYAVWRYWEATGDEPFLAGPGAEILFETARFWTSRIETDGERGHIRGVVGPDEYHHDVNDNAYTNWMARFNLERAAWWARWSGRHAAEAAQWDAVARRLHCPGPDAHGIVEQFAGFFDLAPYPLPATERFKAPLSRLFDWEQLNRLRLIKQADVLMLPFLFPDAFTEAQVAANYDYYEPLTDHGSSLSPAIHAGLAARLGRVEDAERYWTQALWLDLSDRMDNSALGIHPAAMGGTWQALVFGILDVRFETAVPVAAPQAGARLPTAWQGVEMQLAYRGRRHAVKVTRAGGPP
jgi:trehalose/maltose hydrolase-like predicted phosphorylase